MPAARTPHRRGCARRPRNPSRRRIRRDHVRRPRRAASVGLPRQDPTARPRRSRHRTPSARAALAPRSSPFRRSLRNDYRGSAQKRERAAPYVERLPMNADDREAALALLRWYVEMGADEAIGVEAEDRLAPVRTPPPAIPAPVGGQPPRPVPAAPPAALTESMGEAAQSAR